MGADHGVTQDTPSTAELVTFLESRFRSLELLQTIQSLKSAAITPRSQATGGKDSKPMYTNVATQLQCVTSTFQM